MCCSGGCTALDPQQTNGLTSRQAGCCPEVGAGNVPALILVFSFCESRKIIAPSWVTLLFPAPRRHARRRMFQQPLLRFINLPQEGVHEFVGSALLHFEIEGCPSSGLLRGLCRPHGADAVKASELVSKDGDAFCNQHASFFFIRSHKSDRLDAQEGGNRRQFCGDFVVPSIR